MKINKETLKKLKELFSEMESDLSDREHHEERRDPKVEHVEVS